MKTTPDDRRTVVGIAKRLLDKSEPFMLDAGECELMARVIADCHAVFQLHAPIIDAAKRLVTDRGSCTASWQKPWSDLTTAILHLRAWERNNT